jgi:methylenetetrahydrofolate dehydrogenase (NADP+)/methenyltetrahydrofolate cyclohydrolase
LNEEEIKYFISPEKDVDCLSTINIGKVTEGDKTGFPPATPAAVIEMLKYYDIPVEGKNAVVLGRSLVVGKPMSMLLLGENATTTICHSRTRNLEGISKNADILVAAIGRAKMIDEKYVSENSIVLDVGINVDDDGTLCGDVDFEKCKDVCSMITPVPRGVGSVTTSVLAKHVVKAAKLLNNIEL